MTTCSWPPKAASLSDCPLFDVMVFRPRRAATVQVSARKSTTSYWLRIGAVVGLVAIGHQSIVDFSLQIPGNAVLFAALCAVALHRPDGERGRS